MYTNLPFNSCKNVFIKARFKLGIRLIHKIPKIYGNIQRKAERNIFRNHLQRTNDDFFFAKKRTKVLVITGVFDSLRNPFWEKEKKRIPIKTWLIETLGWQEIKLAFPSYGVTPIETKVHF